MRPYVALCLLSALLCVNARGQQNQTYTWSSSNCESCQSTILHPRWFSDGSPLIAEGMSSAGTDIVTAISVEENNFVIVLGLQTTKPLLTINPREAVTLESDSAPRMTLYALAKPDRGIPKNDVMVKQRLGDTLTLKGDAASSGSLFFPVDREASHITIVVSLGEETFRFPFVRDPNWPARFLVTTPTSVGF